MQQMEANIATLVPAGNKNWISMFTEDKSKWIFNTEVSRLNYSIWFPHSNHKLLVCYVSMQCCATTTFYQHAQCIKY
jgi:hypothetical protein